MKNCNTCLYGNQGFCTVHHTVPGGCNDYVQNIPMDDLIELQEYRKIGTVEECREAVEKQKAKKPVPDENAYTIDGITMYDTWYCPNCGHQYEKYYEEYKCCPECGQKIDW